MRAPLVIAVATLLAACTTSAAPSPAGPEALPPHMQFEGPWGFVSAEPPNSFSAAGFANGQGACGAPRQLNIVIRRESIAAGGAADWFLRYTPDAAASARVISVTPRRMTTDFMGAIDTFDLEAGGRLLISHGDTHLTFARCHGH